MVVLLVEYHHQEIQDYIFDSDICIDVQEQNVVSEDFKAVELESTQKSVPFLMDLFSSVFDDFSSFTCR